MIEERRSYAGWKRAELLLKSAAPLLYSTRVQGRGSLVRKDERGRIGIERAMLYGALANAAEKEGVKGVTGHLLVGKGATRGLGDVLIFRQPFLWFRDHDEITIDRRKGREWDKPPSSAGPVCITRGVVECWSLVVRIRFNPAVATPELIALLFAKAGQVVGLDSFRPERGGLHGTFDVDSMRVH